MAKLTRKNQLIFGSTAGTDQLAEFGSLAAGSPVRFNGASADPDVIQSLANYLEGWFGAIIGENSPAVEDMNALCFLFAYQLTYLFQAGVAEWNTAAIYYKGSQVNSGGLTYTSLTDSNTGNAVTDATKWRAVGGPNADQVVIGTAPYCTHATLAAAVADSAVGTNQQVLVTESLTLGAVVNLTKAGWRIRALPGVTLTSSGGGVGGLSVQAARIEIQSLRFASFTTAITYTAGGTYGRVLFSNFSSCTTEVDDTSAPAGMKPVTLGNITE